ncbi:MAG TPA: thiol-disulfide isomerase [Bryobacteraceae bacterium]
MKALACRISVSLTVVVAGWGAVPTYYKDVEPILAKHCQNCHRPGETAPMSFMSYQETRPWVKAIKAAVLTRTMPPWFAQPGAHKFSNDRTLSAVELETLRNWADNGSPEGNTADKQPTKTFVSGWSIPHPDLVVEMANAIEIPAKGVMQYKYVIVPLNLKEDRWVQAIEARPSSPEHVHHAVIYVREPESKMMRDVPPGVPVELPSRGNHTSLDRGIVANEFTTYTPGKIVEMWPPGTAKLLRAGSDLLFSMHYLPNGKPSSDKTRVGMVFAKEPVKQRVLTLCAAAFDFAIPPGAANYPIPAQVEIPNDAKLLRFFPHLHLRAVGFDYWLFSYDAPPDLLLKGTRYDFAWQLTYELEQPITLKRGNRVGFVARYDNSANNPRNPDPSATVRWGELNDSEMISGFFDVGIDARYSIPEWIAGGPPPTTRSSTITAGTH